MSTRNPDAALLALHEKFERAHDALTAADTRDASEGSAERATPLQKTAHAKWERALDRADRIARVICETPAYTVDGMLLKIRACGFVIGLPTTKRRPEGGIESAKTLTDFDNWTTTHSEAKLAAEVLIVLRDDLRRMVDGGMAS